MTSIRYRIVERLFKTLRVNQMLDKQGTDFNKLLEKYKTEQKKPLKVPYKKLNPKFDVDTRSIEGTACYIVREKGKVPEKSRAVSFRRRLHSATRSRGFDFVRTDSGKFGSGGLVSPLSYGSRT